MLHFPPTHLPDKLIMQLRPRQLSTNHPPCRLFQHAPESPAHLFRVTAIKRKPGPDPFVWMVQWASSPGLETDHSISWEVCWTQHSSFSRVFRVWTKSSSLCFPFQMRRKTPSHNLLARLTAPNEFSFSVCCTRMLFTSFWDTSLFKNAQECRKEYEEPPGTQWDSFTAHAVHVFLLGNASLCTFEKHKPKQKYIEICPQYHFYLLPKMISS